MQGPRQTGWPLHRQSSSAGLLWGWAWRHLAIGVAQGLRGLWSGGLIPGKAFSPWVTLICQGGDCCSSPPLPSLSLPTFLFPLPSPFIPSLPLGHLRSIVHEWTSCYFIPSLSNKPRGAGRLLCYIGLPCPLYSLGIWGPLSAL